MTIIAAMDDKRLIGANGDLPWRIPADLKHFKETTMGAAMVMGSTTWKSFGGRALPKRHHVIVTRHPESLEIREADRQNVTVVTNLEIALSAARAYAELSGHNEYFVIGGANIYEQTVPLADKMILTKVQGEYAGDRYFPDFEEWDSKPFGDRGLQTDNGYSFVICEYTRP